MESTGWVAEQLNTLQVPSTYVGQKLGRYSSSAIKADPSPQPMSFNLKACLGHSLESPLPGNAM